MRRLALLALLVAPALRAAAPPSFHCEAYGRTVECRAKNIGTLTAQWAAIYENDTAYRSYGDDFSFTLRGHSRAQIEFHLPDVDGFIPLRIVAMWQRGRVIFVEWRPK